MTKQEIMLEIITIKKLLGFLSKRKTKTISDWKKFNEDSNVLLDRILELEKMLNELDE